MKILLTSVGRRSYLVEYFKDAIGVAGEIHIANSSPMTPAFAHAKNTLVTPLIYDNAYIPTLLSYCKDNEINAVIPLFDIDLPILSMNKNLFTDIGVQVIVSDKSVIDICNDKVKTYSFLINNGFKAPKTFFSLENVYKALVKKDIIFPLIIKPRWGMGSIGVFEVDNEKELEILYNKTLKSIKSSYLKYESESNLTESVIFQEKLEGQEFGLDVVNDLDINYQNTIVKIKHAMRSGETDCAETIDRPILKELGKLLSKKLGHIANLDVDVFMVNDTPNILEMNARFGGGYPFSHVAGVNLPLAIVKWLKKEDVDIADHLTERVGVLSHKDIGIVCISK